MDSVLEKLKELATAPISDAMARMGAMCSSIKPVYTPIKLAGRAVTVQSLPGDPWGSVEAIELAKPGNVIVIDAHGVIDAAVWGEVLAKVCKALGVEGTVIDGATRDVAWIRKIRYPVFARSVCPNAGEPTMQKGRAKLNVTVQCGGVIVKPNDVIVGDDDGVVVVPYEKAEQVAKVAITVEDGEDKVRRMIDSGMKPMEALMKYLELVKREKETKDRAR